MPAAAHRPGTRGVLAVLAAVLALLAHLVVGFFYLTSGLVAPLWAISVLLLWWLVLLGVGSRLAWRGSVWVLAVPVVAFATWLGLLWFGGEVLGWTA